MVEYCKIFSFEMLNKHVIGGFDDKMDEKRTDAQGNFQLDGSESELSPIDPLMTIYHDCNDPDVS